MTTVISNDNFQITQLNHNTFSIQFYIYNEPIIQSIIKNNIIIGTTVDTNFQILNFKATSVKTLKEFKKELFIKNGKNYLPIALAAKLSTHLGSQLKYLINNYSMTIIGIDPKNIIVIDECKFIYLSSEYLTEINENNETCMVSFPIMFDNVLFAPELLNLKEIPSFVHYKSSYFSFGCLLLYALIDDTIFNKFYNTYVKEKDLQQIENCLNSLSIRKTNFFYFIERCLVLEPKNRVMLFI